MPRRKRWGHVRITNETHKPPPQSSTPGNASSHRVMRGSCSCSPVPGSRIIERRGRHRTTTNAPLHRRHPECDVIHSGTFLLKRRCAGVGVPRACRCSCNSRVEAEQPPRPLHVPVAPFARFRRVTASESYNSLTASLSAVSRTRLSVQAGLALFLYSAQHRTADLQRRDSGGTPLGVFGSESPGVRSLRGASRLVRPL